MDFHVLLWIRHLVVTNGVQVLAPPEMAERIIGIAHLCEDGGAGKFLQNEERE